MSVLRYLTHPQVRVDASVPVPRWGLSELGRRRVVTMCSGRSWVDEVGRIVSSDETKALETAAIVALAAGVPVEIRAGLHENDRSATGFVPPERFERLADRFFARPQASIEGWERALDAQSRIVAATADLVADGDGDVLVVGHGAVGTLLLCHLLGVSIDRREDQPAGGGCVWAYDRAAAAVRHRWVPVERAAG